MEKTELLKVTYSLTAPDVEECFRFCRWHHKKNKGTIIRASILAVMTVIWVVSFFVWSDDSFNLLMGVLCFILTLIVFWLPGKNRRDIARMVEESAQVHVMRFYDDRVFFGENESSSFSFYDQLEITETERIFIFDTGREDVFALPKRCLKDGEKEELKNLCINENKSQDQKNCRA